MPVALSDSNQETIEGKKLQFEQEKFDYEKSQSSRNLFLGFLLTTVTGAWITWFVSSRTWKRQTSIDLYRKRFEEGTGFLDTFSKQVGERFYLLQRFLWVLGDPVARRNNGMQMTALRAAADAEC